MKKRLIIGLVCGAAALLTVILGVYLGMGFLNKNNLTCSSNNKANGVNITQNYLIKFENNIINNITIDKKYIYEDQNRFDKFSSIAAKVTTLIWQHYKMIMLNLVVAQRIKHIQLV